MSESEMQSGGQIEQPNPDNFSSGSNQYDAGASFGPVEDVGTDQQEPNDLSDFPVSGDDMLNAQIYDGGLEAMALDFQIIWRGSPNYWAGRNGNKITGICDHIMQSSIESADGWFRNSSAEASAHFGVARDGRIYQWVRLENSAWTNGIVNRPDMNVSWLVDAIRRGINPNTLTIGIEHEGVSGQSFTETQYQATLWLHRRLIQQYGIQPTRQYLIGHSQIDGVNRAYCPGSAFPWSRLLGDLQSSQTVAPAPIAPTPVITDSVPGLINSTFGPGTVNTNNAYVRSYPGFGAGVQVLRKLPAGTMLNFVGYTDQGADFKGNTRWYLIDDVRDKGGWIHALMIS